MKFLPYGSHVRLVFCGISFIQKPNGFPLLLVSNFESISYRFWDIDALCSKIACFPPSHPCLTPLAEEHPAIST